MSANILGIFRNSCYAKVTAYFYFEFIRVIFLTNPMRTNAVDVCTSHYAGLEPQLYVCFIAFHQFCSRCRVQRSACTRAVGRAAFVRKISLEYMQCCSSAKKCTFFVESNEFVALSIIIVIGYLYFKIVFHENNFISILADCCHQHSTTHAHVRINFHQTLAHSHIHIFIKCKNNNISSNNKNQKMNVYSTPSVHPPTAQYAMCCVQFMTLSHLDHSFIYYYDTCDLAIKTSNRERESKTNEEKMKEKDRVSASVRQK